MSEESENIPPDDLERIICYVSGLVMMAWATSRTNVRTEREHHFTLNGSSALALVEEIDRLRAELTANLAALDAGRKAWTTGGEP